MEHTQSNEIERPRSVAQIIGEALDIYQRYPLLFFTLALGVIAPYDLAVLAATGQGPLVSGSHQSAEVSFLLLLLDTVVVGPLVSALHIHAVLLIGQRDTPRLRQVVLSALRVFPVVVAAVIVSAGGIALGFLALVLPGIVLALRWAVVAQVAAVEHEGWIPSLRRSHELTSGHYWHIFVLLVIVGLVSGAITFGAAAIPLGSTSGAASVAAGIAAKTITVSFSALTLAILYFDLRARLATPAASL
ncbi:MAG TPA: hypothetical protein VFY36_04850 [Solirubrobacteraceae bacterium]|nr:hypothetical protein [Solirubrobacteraceae bacterium]